MYYCYLITIEVDKGMYRGLGKVNSLIATEEQSTRIIIMQVQTFLYEQIF